jgi:hypothetical protein
MGKEPFAKTFCIVIEIVLVSFQFVILYKVKNLSFGLKTAKFLRYAQDDKVVSD